LEELVIMLLNVLIKKTMRMLEEGLQTRGASTDMNIVMVFQMEKKVSLIKNINYLSHLKINVLMNMMMFLWIP